jgi:hypothetical protein
METENEDISVTIKAKSIPELVEKLQKILGQYKGVQPSQKPEPQREVVFSEDIKKIYPDYKEHPQNAAMLAAIQEKHKGKNNAVESLELAKEMMQMFPSLFIGKTEGAVSASNVVSGNFLKKRKLINIEVKTDDGWDYRVYWAD